MEQIIATGKDIYARNEYDFEVTNYLEKVKA